MRSQARAGLRPRWRVGSSARSGLDDVEVIFRQVPKINGNLHFGSRLAFAPDGTLFITLGERFQFTPAKDLSNDLGKIVFASILMDRCPRTIPSLGAKIRGPKSGLMTTEIRKALHPPTDRRALEFGPKGGDELNVPQAGKNYGWPVVSCGEHYGGRKIPSPPTHPEFADAIYHWNPVISPSGMTFYTADAIPAWRGNLLIAGLTAEAIIRLTLDGETVTAEERIPMGARIP